MAAAAPASATPATGTPGRPSAVSFATPPPPAPVAVGPSSPGSHSLSSPGLSSPGLSSPGRGGGGIGYRRTGQGPFKPNISHERAIFGVKQASQDVQAALFRIDPESNERDPERALLSGMGILLEAAGQIYTNAQNNLKKVTNSPSRKAERTVRHKDPRINLRTQLQRVAALAKEGYFALEGHDTTLHSHRDLLRDRYEQLQMMGMIVQSAVDAQKTKGLTKSAPAPRPSIKEAMIKSASASPGAASAETPSASPSAATDPSPSESPALKPKPTRANQSALGAAAAAAMQPWSAADDVALLGIIQVQGLHQWPAVAAELKKISDDKYVRSPGACQSRWESLLNVFLSSEIVSGIRKTSDMLLACRKASRDAEAVMNEVAGMLNRAKSDLATATKLCHVRFEDAAEERAWQRTHVQMKMHGTTPEHQRIAKMLQDLGPEKLMIRKLTEAERLIGGTDTATLAEQLGLVNLVIEVGNQPAAPVTKNPLRYLRVRDTSTGEICLEWDEPHDKRVTDPKGGDVDALTQKLHGMPGADE